VTLSQFPQLSAGRSLTSCAFPRDALSPPVAGRAPPGQHHATGHSERASCGNPAGTVR